MQSESSQRNEKATNSPLDVKNLLVQANKSNERVKVMLPNFCNLITCLQYSRKARLEVPNEQTFYFLQFLTLVIHFSKVNKKPYAAVQCVAVYCLDCAQAVRSKLVRRHVIPSKQTPAGAAPPAAAGMFILLTRNAELCYH